MQSVIVHSDDIIDGSNFWEPELDWHQIPVKVSLTHKPEVIEV